MYLSSSILAASLAATVVVAVPEPHSSRNLKPFSGNFTINQYQLYPENADFDFNTGKLYIGQLWNASLGIYDPYTKKHEVVEFPGISHNPAFNMGGVGVNKKTSLVSLIANSPLEFPTNGANISGTRYLLTYNPQTHRETSRINLTATSQGRYAGFQDLDFDPRGNTFVVGTFPSSLLRVSADGKSVTPWYLPARINATDRGLTGVASVGWTLLAYGDASGALWRFDMREERGTPRVVPVQGNHTFRASDAVYLPKRYGGRALLVAERERGTSVFWSADGWESAVYAGTVPLPRVDPGTVLVAPVQVGDAIYQVLAYFGDQGVNGPGTAGNRSAFPFYDISEEVDALVKKCQKGTTQKREEVKVAGWWYKGNTAKVEKREEGEAEVAGWWYKGNTAKLQKRGEAEEAKVAGWWYKGNTAEVQKREEGEAKVAGWWYKGHTANLQKKEQTPEVKVAGWWYKGHTANAQKREQTPEPKVAGWWYKSNTTPQKRQEEEEVKVAGWWYKGHS